MKSTPDQVLALCDPASTGLSPTKEELIMALREALSQRDLARNEAASWETSYHRMEAQYFSRPY